MTKIAHLGKVRKEDVGVVDAVLLLRKYNRKSRRSIAHFDEMKQEDIEAVNAICCLAKRKKFGYISSSSTTNSWLLCLAVQKIASEEVVDVEALECLIDSGANVKDAVESAAFAGDVNIVLNLIKWGPALSCHASKSAALGGHFNLVEEIFFNKYYPMKELWHAVKGASLGGYLNDEKQALQVLLSFNNHELREKFANEMHAQKQKDTFPLRQRRLGKGYAARSQRGFLHLNYDPRLLLEDANRIEKSSKVTSEQRAIFHTPEIQALFLCCKPGPLPSEIYFIMAAYLHDINEAGVKNLFENMPLEMKKVDITALRGNYLSSSWFAFLRDKRYLTCMKACQEAKSAADFEKVLEDEVLKNPEKGDYRSTLENHLPRKNPGKK